MTQDGPRPPVTGPGPSIATAPRSAAAVTPPRTSSPPLRGHAVSPAPGSEMMAAVFEMLRSQERDRKLDRKRQEQQQELDRKRQEQQQELDRKRQEQDRERDHERERLLIEIRRENSAGLQQLRRDMANSPRFSRRGTPTGTPVPAADDSPRHAPVKHPLRRILPSPPYQVADRHPGSAETTPPPHHVPVHTESSRTRTSTVDPPTPYTATTRGLMESFRPLGPPPHPPREVAPPRSSPPPVARITTHPPSQCRPPKPDPSPVTNNDQLQAIVAAVTTALAHTQRAATSRPAAASECIPAPRHEPHTVPVRYDPPPAHDECPEPVHAYSLGRVHDGRYSPYQQPPPHPPTQPMQPTVNDPPPESTHHHNQSPPQASADSRHSLEDGPSRVTPSVVGVSHGLDHEFTVRGDSAVLPPGPLTNITLMQEPEPTSHLAVVKADGNITLPHPLADVQGTTSMPCSLVADLSAPVPREARQPDDPTDPTPDLVGEQLTLEVESGLASLRAPDSAPGPMKGPPPALTVSDEVAPGTGPKEEIPPPPGFPPSQPLAVLQPLNAPPTTDDDDVRNASHVASDRDSTPPIGVPVWSTSAPRGWTAELQDYKKRKKGKIVMDVVIMPWPLPVSRDVFDHCCPPPLSRQSDPPPTHPPYPSHSYSFHVTAW